MAEIKPKLRVDVNHNPTKKGIKVQFVLPQTLEGDAKAQATQKLQSKLNQGLEQYNLTVSQDTDVPYSNVIGFLIPIADIKLLIKNAIGGGQAAPEEAPAPEETPAPEEPMKEIKRMQELAGIINEATIRDLIKPLRSELESMGYEVDIDPSFGFPIIEAFKTLQDGSILRMTVQPSEDEIQKKMDEPVAGETIDVSFTLWTTKVTNKLFGLYKQKSRDMQNLPDEAGINIDLGTGMFDIPVEQSIERIISLLKNAEQKVVQS